MRELEYETALSLARLLPPLSAAYGERIERTHWDAFTVRLERHFGELFRPLLQLYGDRYDFFYHLQEIVAAAARSWVDRRDELKRLDAAREAQPRWFQSHSMVGAVCYTDLFAGTLACLRARIPYFLDLGVTYLHLMPLFAAPAGNSDGGYAVSSYREVNPALGTMDDLAALAAELRAHGISLVLDFIFNHTSDEHRWAQAALAGQPEFQDYYYMFADRRLPDAYEQHLRAIFPDQRPGSFTYRQDIQRWVWTTFHSFQWDLNYSNPTVFQRMGEEMLFLANHGAEVLRLDAVAFAWKQLGTTCESLPQVHLLVQAFNALARIAAPALIFKSEAIVHPDEVAQYIAPRECQISYNPLLMALLWEALATRETRLLQLSMVERFAIDRGCAWVNYVRSHDDIGWTFADGDAARLGIDSFGHRRFLNDFYTGRFPGTFASGLPFQENPRTGDARVSGTCASLAGLERALFDGDDRQSEHAVRRMLLLYGVVLSVGGIPLIYLGDETGTLNDYGYLRVPAKADDSRWVHRPRFDWTAAEKRADASTVQGQIFLGLQRMITLRKDSAVFGPGTTTFVDCANGSVLAYRRSLADEEVLVLANFSEREQTVAPPSRYLNGGSICSELLGGAHWRTDEQVTLPPYALLWLRRCP